MMSGATIAHLARQATRRASREHKYPTIVEAEDITDAKAVLAAGRTPRLDFPFIGDWRPHGYAPTENLYFVDASGWGSESEPALTQRAFIEKLRPGYAYAVVEAGQFQVYVQEYEVRTYTTRRA